MSHGFCFVCTPKVETWLKVVDIGFLPKERQKKTNVSAL